MKTRTLFTIAAIAAATSFIGTSCNKSDNDNVATAVTNTPGQNATLPQGLGTNGNWQTIATRTFTIEAPSTWSLTEMPSMDTYTGQLAGGSDRMNFEYGTTMNAYQMDPEHYSYHYETINKLKALIIESNDGSQRFGVAIDSVSTREGTQQLRRFVMMQSSESPMARETAMRMIRSIKFNP